MEIHASVFLLGTPRPGPLTAPFPPGITRFSSIFHVIVCLEAGQIRLQRGASTWGLDKIGAAPVLRTSWGA